MGMLQNPLGINLTNRDPVNDSPFSGSADEGDGGAPPGVDRMITETGIYMLTETTSSFMDTE